MNERTEPITSLGDSLLAHDSVAASGPAQQRWPRFQERRASAAAATAINSDFQEPPYSLRVETWYFFRQGVPLVLSSILEWGIPPLAGMVIAGHVKDGSSATLQASLGFARIYYNVSCLMPCISLLAYIKAVVPGCVGAKRVDRIPRYFQRSMLLSFCLLVPSLFLQLYSERFLLAVHVPHEIATPVGIYTRVQIGTACLFLLECHLEQLFISLGYSTCDAFIGLVSGLGLDVGCTYYFVYIRGYGMLGFALKEVVVKASRIVLWLLLSCAFGLWHTLFVPLAAAKLEPLFTWRELRIFFSQVAPRYVQSLSGWLIFELQLLALSSIPGMTNEGRAAGAIWVQCESALAATMAGWITVANLRAQKLLGGLDSHGAARSFLAHNILAALLVAVFNTLPLLLFDEPISKLVTNDAKVRHALEPLLWVLAVHVQTRITNLATGNLLIPVGKPWLNVLTTFFAFYVLGAPVSALGAFTNLLVTDLKGKMLFCVGCTSIAQAFLAVVYVIVLCRLDWSATARMVHSRAQSDQRGGELTVSVDAPA